MSGFEPILIGSALGAMTNSKNPLQGALLGGVLGGVGGAAMGGFKAAGSAGTAGLAGGGGSGMFTAGTQLANPAASGTYFTAGTPAAGGSLQAGGNAVMKMGQTAIGTSPSLGSQLSGSLQGVTQFAKENPFAMSSGLNAAQQLYGEQPMEFPQAPGLLRGNPIPEQPPSYAAMSPMQPITLI